MPSKGAVDPVALFVKFCHNAQEVHSDTDEGEALVLFNRLAAAAVARKPQVDHLLRLLWRSRTKEMMQPCLTYLHVISLVAQVGHLLSLRLGWRGHPTNGFPPGHGVNPLQLHQLANELSGGQGSVILPAERHAAVERIRQCDMQFRSCLRMGIEEELVLRQAKHMELKFYDEVMRDR